MRPLRHCPMALSGGLEIMSDTPRSDEVFFSMWTEAEQALGAMYKRSCELERELNAALGLVQEDRAGHSLLRSCYIHITCGTCNGFRR